MEFLVKGILIGIMFGVPVGTVGTMTIQKTMSHGVKAGITTGLGSSTADCLYAIVGVLGLNIIMDFLFRYEVWINAAGGIFLLIMGIRTIRKQESSKTEEKETGLFQSYAAAFVVGITNPVVIVTFLFAFTFFEIPAPLAYINGLSLVFGVFTGTLFWWISLSVLIGRLKEKGAIQRIKHKNRIFGIIYIIFSFLIFGRMLFGA